MYVERTTPEESRHAHARADTSAGPSPWTARAGLLHPLPASWEPALLSVLRIVTAFGFIVHGTQKLFAFPVAGSAQPVELGSLMGAAGILEFAGGAMLLVGLLTRPIAFLLSGEMAFAYFMQHAPKGFWPALNGGELAMLYCFLFLFFAAAGPGPWSLDAAVRRATMHGRPQFPDAHPHWRPSH